jgi:4'-phosphopantetheinyl transferase
MSDLQLVRVRPGAPWSRLRALAARAQGSVDIWAVSLAASAHEVTAWRALLSPTELERAARFVRPADRDRFSVAHGVLRQVIACYCAVAPHDLRFTQLPGGKPALEPLAATSDLRFSLSHSGGGALIAIGRGVEVGIDLEHERGDLDIAGLAERFFHEDERKAIGAAAEPVRAFFRQWVAKEALLKAHGTGLTLPLDAFAIDLITDPPVVAAAALPELARGDWRIRMLRVSAPWHAAICTRPDARVRIVDAALAGQSS